MTFFAQTEPKRKKKVSETLNNFPERLRNALASRRWNRETLAKEARVSASTVKRWVDGSIPRTKTIEEVAGLLRVSSEWLRTGEGDMHQLAAPNGQDKRGGGGGGASSGKEPSGSDFDALALHVLAAAIEKNARAFKIETDPIERIGRLVLLEQLISSAKSKVHLEINDHTDNNP